MDFADLPSISGTNVNLVTIPKSLVLKPGGNVTGDIWLEISGQQFPNPGWNDFVIVVMGWWSAALVNLIRGKANVETVHFMEGPYTAEVEIASSKTLKIRVLRRVTES